MRLPGRNFRWISGPLLTFFSGDGGAKFSKKLKLDVRRKLPGLTAVGKHARTRKGHEAQLSLGCALRSRRTFGVLLRIWRRNLRLRRSRAGSFALNESSTTGSRSRLNVVAGMFMAIFEGKLGDARFIARQCFCDHALLLGREVLESPSNA